MPEFKQFRAVAVYARVSTPNQREQDLSVPDQIDKCRAFCKENGWPVVAEFTDEGISGGKQVARVEFMRMLEAATSKTRPFDLILTRDFERFGRGDFDNPNRAKLRQHGVRVDNVDDPVGDMGVVGITPNGKNMERLRSVQAISYREGVAPKVIAAQKRATAQGRVAGSSGTCFGYKSVYAEGGPNAKRETIIDSYAGPIVREMFKRYAEGSSLLELCRWLEETGVKSPSAYRKLSRTNAGENTRDIADSFAVSRGAIQFIRRGQTWRYLDD